MKYGFLIWALSLAVLSSPSYGQSHTLFDKGKSTYTIVVAPESSECVKYAASELSYWLHEVSGIEIPVMEDLDAGKRGKRLVVGYNVLTGKVLKDATGPQGVNDSFTYSSSGGDVFLWGDTDRGTLYAVYSLLEKEFGCRWYSNRVWTAPKCESWSFDRLYNREVPAIRMRNNFYYDVIAHPEFATRTRSNSCLFGSIPSKMGGSLNYWSAHTLPHFVPVEKYFEEHPEYFSEIDGKRIKDKAQICLSNPDVLKIVTEEVRKAMREHPEFLIYSVSQGDYDNPCQCEKCRALKEQYGNEESGVIVWFVNQVADAVKDEFPDKFVGTFAYCYSRHVPKNIVPRDNVVIRFCAMEVCQLHKLEQCQANLAFLKDLSGWAATAPHTYIWDYTTIFTNYALPLPNLYLLQDRMKRYRDSGAIGVMSQGSYQSVINAFEDLKAYVLSKLQWNPDCDVDAVIKDFTDGFFGPDAGPIVRDYLAYESKALVNDKNFGSIFSNEDAAIYSDEFVKQGREYFAKAKAAVTEAGGDQTQVLIERLEYAEIGLCLLETLRNPELGRADGSLDLIKRVVKREGITFLREFKEHRKADEYIQFLETHQSKTDK